MSKIISFIFLYLNSNSLGSSADAQKDPGRARVPVVCLERLKILVSQLPAHGRRQSDPLPASGTNVSPPQSSWQATVTEVSFFCLLDEMLKTSLHPAKTARLVFSPVL